MAAEKILVAVAWPYTNGYIHLGHLAGCYVAADIFARYHRLKGNKVLMVSGSDQHGTPITVTAEEEGLTPQQVVDKYRPSQLDTWRNLGVTFDLFTSTGTENHKKVVQDIFRTLADKGLAVRKTTPLLYSEADRRFLPDRYVEGTCPFCDYEKARGDQCDTCGRPMDPLELKDPRSRLSGATPEVRESEHYFLRLSALQDSLLEWVQRQTHWRPNVLNFTQGYIKEGLHDRPITRDIDWGVPVPVEDYGHKRVYVWFEAVIGYLSASKEWAALNDKPEAWREFWEDPEARTYYFVGKDNIPFHTIIWPAILMGYGNGLALPYDVPANEYLNMYGGKFSKSERRAVWVKDYLERYEPDPLRYYLSASMPETSDTDFTWDEFVRRNNDELVATYGNLVHRALTLIRRGFDGRVPQPGEFSDVDRSLMAKANDTLSETASHISRTRFRDGLRAAMSLAQEANRYLDSQAPWHTIKEDRDRTATSLWVTLHTISTLKTVTYPYLPFSAERLHTLLGLPGTIHDHGWSIQQPEPGVELPSPQALFAKLDDSVAEEETRRMEEAIAR